MKVAQITPLWETVPPKTYGGTELVASLLSEGLIKQGHEVTLFAAKGSELSKRFGSRIEICAEASLRELGVINQGVASQYYELQLSEKVLQKADQFDIIHNHLGFQLLPFASVINTPMVTTLHGVFEPPFIREFVRQYKDLPFISISDYQRTPCPELNYMATIYHGIPVNLYQPTYSHRHKTYLAFLGRFSLEKGPHHAIRIAKETGWPLIMAGKVDPVDRDFFETTIQPHIDGQQIRFIGEVNHPQKVELLRHAAATLCPVTWPEPFGLVLIESLACGTPVLALRNGSIPEIIEEGATGFIGNSVEELIEAVSKIRYLDRRNCRSSAESYFSVERMTQDYLSIYRLLLERSSKVSKHPQVKAFPFQKRRKRIQSSKDILVEKNVPA